MKTLISVDAMKKSMYLLFAIAAMASVACEHTEELAPEAPATGLVQRDFTALVTKTALSGSDVVWQEGDEISVFAATGSAVSDGGAEYGLKNYDAEKATFTGSIAAADSYFAVYPYSTSNAFDGDLVLTASVPAQQVITSGSFAPGAAVVVSKATENYQFLFQNAVALLKVTLADSMSGATKIEISGNNGEIIAGAFTATYGKSGFTFADAASGTSTTASLVYEGGTFVGGQPYYIAIRPCEFSKGLTAKAYFGDGNSDIAVKTSSAQVTVAAGQILTLGTFDADSWAPTLELGDFETLTLSSGTYLTFDYGQSETFPVNLASGVNTSDLQDDGWTVSYSNGSVTITAPANNGSHAPQPDAIVLTSTQNSSVTTSYGLRLRGIGSVEELKAVDAITKEGAEGNIENYTVTTDSIQELFFTSDLLIGAKDLRSDGVALYHNMYPIHGNGRTVEFDNISVGQALIGFMRDLRNDVHDLNFKGAFTTTAGAANIGSLASRAFNIAGNEVKVTNVTSSVALTWNPSKTTGNTYVGGLVGYMYQSGNKSIVFTDCSYGGSGAVITMNGEVMSAGGIIGQGEATGTDPDAWTVFENCDFNGRIVYKPDQTQTKNTRIGGIVGNSERQLKVINTHSAGRIDVYLNQKVFATGNGRAIGGFFGRSTAADPNHPEIYMAFRMDDKCNTSTNIYIWGVNESEWKKAFQIRGYANCTRSDLTGNPIGETNIPVLGGAAIHYDNYSTPAVNGSGTTTSFNYGEARSIDVSTGDLTGWASCEGTLKGWTIDASHILDGKISVTAPTQDKIRSGEAVGAGNIEFELTHDTGETRTAAGSGVAVRLYGINSKEEFNSFKAIYGAAADTPTTTGLDDYLVNDKITLNTDLSFSGTDITLNAYVIKNLVLPLEGNNRKITSTISGSAGIIAVFQNLKANVSNLHLAGLYTSTRNAKDFAMGALGGYAAASIIVSNVHVDSGTTIAYNTPSSTGLTGTYVGGLIGKNNGVFEVQFENCTVAAEITTQNVCAALGGIIGDSGSVSGTSICRFTDCTFSGSIVYTINTDITSNSFNRVGGIVGDLARKGYFTRCYNTGAMSLIANNHIYTVSGTSSNAGFGGIIGRNTATAAGYTMAAYLDTVENRAPIIIKNLSSNQNTGISGGVFGQIIGSKRQEPNQYVNVTESGSLEYVTE